MINFKFKYKTFLWGLLIITLFPFLDFGIFCKNIDNTNFTKGKVDSFYIKKIGRKGTSLKLSVVKFEYENNIYSKTINLANDTQIGDEVDLLVCDDSGELNAKALTLFAIYLDYNFYNIITLPLFLLWLCSYRYAKYMDYYRMRQFHYYNFMSYYNAFKKSENDKFKIKILLAISFLILFFGYKWLGIIILLLSCYLLGITYVVFVDTRYWLTYKGIGFYYFPLNSLKKVQEINQLELVENMNQYEVQLTLDNEKYTIFNSENKNFSQSIYERVKTQLNEYL